MDLNKIIRELMDERKKLDRIVTSLEQLTMEGKLPTTPKESRRGRKSMDSKSREEVSKRMKRYWDKRRNESAKS